MIMTKLNYISIILFIVAIFYYLDSRDHKNDYIDNRSQPFNLDNFLNDGSVNYLKDQIEFNYSSYTIIYVIPSTECNVCVNEIFNIYNYSSSINSDIEHVIFVYDSDTNKAKHALLTSDIQLIDNMYKIYGSENWIDKYMEINNTKRSRVALLVNNKNNIIEYKLYLKSGLMSDKESFKRFIPTSNN